MPTNTNGIIRRVINGRVFKQVAALCSNKVRLQEETTQDILARNEEESILEEGLVSTRAGVLDAVQRNSTRSLIHSSQQNASSSVTRSKPQNVSHQFRLCDESGYLTTRNEAPVTSSVYGPEHSGDELQQTTEGPPINNRHPEIISFEDRHGKRCSAVTLTRQLLADWNTVFQWEERIASYYNEIHDLGGTRAKIEHMIVDIGEQLEREARNVRFNKEKVIDQRKRGMDIRYEIMDREEKLHFKIQHAQKDFEISKEEVIGSWKQLLAENNLLEQNLEDSGIESQSSGYPGNEALSEEIRIPQTPASSEVARLVLSEEQDATVENLHDKEVRLYRARRRVDHWNEYYDSEYKRYCDGTMSQSKTVFDNTMLRNQMAATKLLVAAEKEFEIARAQAKELGVDNNDIDQESGFLDNVEDGHHGSMEAAIVKHVDRGRIVEWMEAEDRPSSPYESEGEAWDSKTIDLGDSVSVVAEGKERKRIDHWRSLCEMIEVEFPRGVEASEEL